MQRMTTRFLSVFLTALMLFSVVACADRDTPAETTAAPSASTTAAPAETTLPEETEYKAVANVPDDLKYAGHEFNIYISHNTENGREKNDFKAEEQTGEALNDAIFKRNQTIEERFGIKIKTFEDWDSASFGAGKAFKTLSQAQITNTYEYDAAMVGGYDTSTLAYQGYLYDLNTVPYIDTDQPWWDQKCNTDLTIAGKLFYTTGDISTADNDATCAILFNKDLREQFYLEDPYKLVAEGNWTLDKMIEMAQAVPADLNNDGRYHIEDRVGALIWQDTILSMVNATGARCAIVDTDGNTIKLTINDERIFAVIDKYLDAFLADGMSYGYQRDSYDITNPLNMFANKQALFYTQLLDLVSYLRNMETDFGILPHPKFTETQDEYYNTVGSYHSVFLCVPGAQENIERTGAIIEALAAESMNIVTPAYYEKTLVGRYVRDEESVATLDIILATRVYDLGWFYQLGNYNNTLINIWASGNNTFSSQYRVMEKIANKTLDKINDAYAKLGS